ncbi:efflux RND transporter periplasmic adaptor subunit [Indioceanicola profundi]|uniref:efflux RND transporter periplasmic adaptor subunit n=1 Tax=Indioceanicola profundi TaxID=2220096 RepID=UPI000E6ACFC2|nr:efflux RND transporter periplasmic adaptor subunit [Indioceanicola profundi]
MPQYRPNLGAVAVIALTLSLPLSNTALAQGAPPPAKVVVQPVAVRTMAPQIEMPGAVHSRQDAAIAAEVSGRVVWVAEAGTRVAAGEPVARLDDRVLALELQGLEAQIRSLEAQLDFQSREVTRLVELAKRGSAPQSRLEEATSRRDVLAQELVQARVAHERTALELERTVVKAPFAGQVAARMIEVGEYSSPGARIARLVAVDDLEVRVQAPVSIAPNLREGMTVQLVGSRGPAEGRISRIIPIGEQRSRTFEVRVDLPDDSAWIVGAAVKVALPSAPEMEAVAIHRDALLLRGGGSYVYRIKSDNTAERVPVRTALSQGEWIAVEGELSPGDRLVVRGAERLREGQSVDLDPKLS